MTFKNRDMLSLNRRTALILIGGVVIIAGAVTGLILLLTGGTGEETATGPTAAPTSSPTPSPSPIPTEGPPTVTPTASSTPTLQPYEHVVQTGETLYFIIQLYGYRDTLIVPELLLLNGMASENDVYEGQTLLIPRQTPTPGATSTLPPVQAGEGEATGEAGDYAGCSFENRCVSPDGNYWVHEVSEGDTIAGLAFIYYSRVDAILQANNLPSDPIINIGEIIYVPILVTSTPTLTPTGGPDSTATPTPTVAPPSLLSPANKSTIARGERVALQWAASHPLIGDQHYLVIVRNTATDEEYKITTRSNVHRLPESLRPGAGRSIEYEWQIVVVNGSDPDSPVVGGYSLRWTFTWGS